MITDAIHDYVAGQLSGLWSLPKPQRRAQLAELRRGVGHQPGDLGKFWEIADDTAKTSLRISSCFKERRAYSISCPLHEQHHPRFLYESI